MSSISSVALIGLGEVGQILAADLSRADRISVTAYDILFSDPDSSPSRADVPVRRCRSMGEAVKGCDLVISAVTAASDFTAAAEAAGAMAPKAFFLDLNSVSPVQKVRSAEIINGAGGRYIEAAVMTPFPPKRIASPMLLGGPHAKDFLSAAQGLGFSATVLSGQYGQASATKMCRSVIIKGIEALLTESMLAARHYRVEESVLSSLSDLLPAGDWRKIATYMISRSLEHGKRRAEEMREVAQTVSESGVTPFMTEACVIRQEWAGDYRGALNQDLNKMLDAILEAAADSRKKSHDH